MCAFVPSERCLVKIGQFFFFFLEKCRRKVPTIKWNIASCETTFFLCLEKLVSFTCTLNVIERFQLIFQQAQKRADFSFQNNKTKSSHIFGSQIYACQWHKQWCHFRHWNTDSFQIDSNRFDSTQSCATDLVSFKCCYRHIQFQNFRTNRIHILPFYYLVMLYLIRAHVSSHTVWWNRRDNRLREQQNEKNEKFIRKLVLFGTSIRFPCWFIMTHSFEMIRL